MRLFDFEKLFKDTSQQVIWLLAIVAICLMVMAYATQGFARAAISILGVFVLIMLILLLANATEIGQWLKDQIFIGENNRVFQPVLLLVRLL